MDLTLDSAEVLLPWEGIFKNYFSADICKYIFVFYVNTFL